MKNKLKLSIAMFLSVITILNFSMISFADTANYENEKRTIEIQSANRFTYKTERSKPVTRKNI
ncbi:hypothetical protein GOQ27_06090 [Clostridium sp. D2Q-11]|uniref:Uncharacterized protein n=1 Tax=Anaeromonas frigoriresistens TaxID=2683708 RepID=A0A942URU4_9FIRM|nr:hypothetical protein [Anaeromonas frigoriresistens]MBS4538023.1 hypothetical protein [Anaeromonas frigoriresistens]